MGTESPHCANVAGLQDARRWLAGTMHDHDATSWRRSRANRRNGPTLCRGVTVTFGVAFLATASGCKVIETHVAKHRIERGDALVEAQDLDAALKEFEAAAEIAPQMAVAHSRMGVIYRRVGDYSKAIDCFIEAIRRDPFSFDDTLNLAQLYHFTDRIKDAIQAYLHAVELRPDHFDAQLNLGVCYQQVGDLSEAVERFQRAIEVDPDRPHAYVNLGVALDAQGKHYEAISAYKAALERDSRQPLVLVNLAHTYMNQDRMRMARQSLEQAIRMDPNLAAAHETLGYCLFRTRDFGAAERAYSFALSCDPKLPRAHAGLGSIKMLGYLDDPSRLELRVAALEHWHRSLELDPDQPKIRKLIAQYKPKHSDPETVLLDERGGS